jgi:hypothetical protein
MPENDVDTSWLFWNYADERQGKNNEGMSRRVYKRRVARGKGKGELNGKVKKLRVLVDYELPEGEERLEWDTDEVRLMAGEIE